MFLQAWRRHFKGDGGLISIQEVLFKWRIRALRTTQDFLSYFWSVTEPTRVEVLPASITAEWEEWFYHPPPPGRSMASKYGFCVTHTRLLGAKFVHLPREVGKLAYISLLLACRWHFRMVRLDVAVQETKTIS